MSEAGSDSSSSDAAAGDDGANGTGAKSGSSGGLVGTWPRRVGAVVVALVALLAVLYALGVVGAPGAGIDDRGDWGEVSEERTEILTTVWVNNPNPVGVALGDSVAVDYDIVMNDVVLAEGQVSDVDVPSGNSTETITTELINDRLGDWWVGYVRANETVNLRVDGTVTVSALATVDRDLTFQREILGDDQPVIDALSASVNQTNGTYTESVDASEVDDSVVGELGDDESVTVGYEVQRGWATWGEVTENETEVVFHLRIHNPGDVPVPAAPDGIGVAIDANDVRLLEAESDEFTLRGVDTDAVIPAGETREVAFVVTMDNERVDDWFTSHVREDRGPGEEATTVSSQFQVVFRDPATGQAFRLPADSPATYDCDFQTAILVDDQATGSDCGNTAAPVDG